MAENIKITRTNIEFILFFSVLVDIDFVLVVVDDSEEVRERSFIVEEGEPEEVMFVRVDFEEGEDVEEATDADELVAEGVGVE